MRVKAGLLYIWKMKLTLSILLFSFTISQVCRARQFAADAGGAIHTGRAADTGGAADARTDAPNAPTDGYYQFYSNPKPSLTEGKSTSRWYFKVIGTTDSSLSINCTLLSYKSEVNGQVFNTDDPVTSRPFSSTELEMLSLLNRPFLYTLKNEGVADQTAIVRIFEERITSWQIGEHLGNMMKQNAKSYFIAEMRALFNNQPIQEVIITRLDPKEIKTPPSKEELRSREEVITAIVTASNFSQALYRASLADSAKVEDYFARYDPVYGNANFYRLIKLDLLTSNLTANMDRYESLLLATPDSILAPYPSHLFNKAQEAYKISADSAYPTIRYLSKHKNSFQSWVQESFSQGFLYHVSPEEAKAELKKRGITGKDAEKMLNEVINAEANSKALIDKLAYDNDTTFHHEIYPLYLWVQAKEHASNKDSVLRIAGELENISNSKVYSNPHRYGLLVYKQLLASGDTTEAAHLLDNQIAGMAETVKDSTYPDRYADQNMLAYAFKLKSDAVKATDPKAAMTWLSKAASYSPGSQKEKIYMSFYDRVFLDSKESYRPEFAEALIRQGNTKEGMVVLTQQLNTDPSIIEELQKAFEKNLPQADFYRFFNDGVVRSWKTAPDFSLKSPDGKTSFKLGDYSGKWLLIDFWGTWCSPCREEMPKINDFVKKIEARKDLAFLSVACRDGKENVTRFLADKNYQIPVCMSDNTIESKYEVPYYPSKFLVSPAGTVLPISNGQDWQKILEQFASLHPKKVESKLVQQKNN